MDGAAHHLRALYEVERERALRFVRRMIGEHSVAEDIVQQVFLRLLTAGPVANSRATLFTAARNLALNHRRDVARRRECGLSDDAFGQLRDRAPDPETIALYRSELQRLCEAVAALPPRRREIFVLSRFEGCSHAEIAQRLGIAPRTVVNQLVAALSALDRHLGAP